MRCAVCGVLTLLLVLSRTHSADQSQCVVDDFIDIISRINLRTGEGFEFGVIRPSGPCENQLRRQETNFQLSPRPNENPPISIPEERVLDFTPPFCLAFTVTLPSREEEYLLHAMDPPFVGKTVASLQVSSAVIRFVLGSSEATFGPPNDKESFVASDHEFIHLQVCVSDTGQASLHTNCGDVQQVKFISDQYIGGSLLTLLQNATVNGGGSFSGSVLQMYSISCNGLDQHSSIVEVQCAAVPLDCSKPSLIDPATGGSISSVVSDYLSSLDMSTPQPQMFPSPVADSGHGLDAVLLSTVIIVIAVTSW